jgi:hypothetical protein
MNMFILDKDIVKSVQMHNDAHVRKVTIEAIQMLSIAAAYHKGLIKDVVDPYGKRYYSVFKQHDELYDYNKSQASHPITVWTRTCLKNTRYMYDYADALLDEYEYRFGEIGGRARDVFTKSYLILACDGNIAQLSQMTKFYQCMPDQYKNPRSVVKAYRDYYRFEKAHLIKYTKRPVPKFLFVGN